MEDMKKAYKKKALIHHPDRNGGVQSDEFLRLKQAYDNLIDPAKRRNYDAFHHTGEFKKEGRPLSAKEAAWLVDQQKRSWGVKEIHPFAVCILCDSCPCPADGVCDGCGMTASQFSRTWWRRKGIYSSSWSCFKEGSSTTRSSRRGG